MSESKGPGRYNLYFTGVSRERIEAAATASGMSVSAYIRLACEEKMERDAAGSEPDNALMAAHLDSALREVEQVRDRLKSR